MTLSAPASPLSGPNGGMDSAQPEAGPSSASSLRPAETSYHATSQFRHWRYSPAQLRSIREELSAKSVEVVARNQALEKEAQISLGHSYTDPPPASSYLSVTDELDLLHFYVLQASKICRSGFGLPESVESTAVSYLKRFYLKNSVMEWHPKTIMPTCLFLAAKTTNYPVPIDVFVSKIAKLKQSDVLDTEFLLAQSLSFEFWVRGADKAVRGWALELQERQNTSTDDIQRALPAALEQLARSRQSDAEFLYTPGQIGLACWFLADEGLVRSFLEWRYANYTPRSSTTAPTNGAIDAAIGDAEPDEAASEPAQPYGMTQERLLEIVSAIAEMISSVVDTPLSKIKEIDKRLKGCTNPEKTPGTALYLKRKRETEAAEAAARAAKTLKAQQIMADRESVFGDVIQPPAKRKPLSPRLTIPTTDRRPPTPSGLKEVVAQRGKEDHPGGAGTGEGDGAIESSGMGIRDEAMGVLVGGQGLKHVAEELDSD